MFIFSICNRRAKGCWPLLGGGALARGWPRAASAAMVLLLGAACAPEVQLKRPHRFSSQDVKLTLWSDRCGLQSFFDANPPPNQIVYERGWTERIAPGRARERGVITVRVTEPRQRRQLRSLLARYYRASGSLLAAPSYEVTLSYVRICDRPRMMAGSPVTVRAGGETLSLAYHPCVGEYLLNRDLYEFRASLLRKGELKVADRSRSSRSPHRRVP